MIGTLLLFIVILGVVVLVHESGHFLFAKLVGIHVSGFSIGFGPVIFQKEAKDKTKYSLRAIPLGGFVSLAGEEVNVDREKQKGKNLQDKTVWQRFLVMFMGVGFNFIFAFLLLFFIGIIFGSHSLKPVLAEVTNGYPAYEAGLSSGDKVLEINNKKVKYLDDIMLYIQVEDLSKPLIFKVEKENKSIATYTVQARKEINQEKEETYVLGIAIKANKQEKTLGNAIKYSFDQGCAIFKQMFIVLGNLFTGGISVNQLSGPVGIYSIVGTMKNEGINSILYLIALLSINVGVINLLPFPAFDGGRILFLIIEKVKGSPVSTKVENIIHSIGFALLMLLMVYITFNDILKLF